MKRTLIVTVTAISLFSSSLFAFGSTGRITQDQSKQIMHQQIMKKKSVHSVSQHFINLVYQLNLSKEQSDKIYKIITTEKPEKALLFDTFSESNFDKEKFLSQMDKQSEFTLKSKADKIEKIYSILTSNQKKQLRVLMDLKERKSH